eukprot:10878823-Karenia_brevis.AAC.1
MGATTSTAHPELPSCQFELDTSLATRAHIVDANTISFSSAIGSVELSECEPRPVVCSRFRKR